jgi:hypothetical protein
MNETPDLMWLAVTTLGVLALGGMLSTQWSGIEPGRTGAAPAQPTDHSPDSCGDRTCGPLNR